jgi:hypothetical protein
MNLATGNYDTDYLLRAAIAKTGLGANLAKEALYPIICIDNEVKNLTGYLLLLKELFLSLCVCICQQKRF